MGEDIATQVSDKGLLSTLHKELPHIGKEKAVNIKKNNCKRFE